MKVGDLVRCVWQPTTSRVENDCALPMKHTIKGELGLITDVYHSRYGDRDRYKIAFPQLGYAHTLSDSAFEVIK